MKKILTLLTAFLLLLSLAACGSGNKETTPAQTKEAAPAETTKAQESATTAAPAPETTAAPAPETTAAPAPETTAAPTEEVKGFPTPAQIEAAIAAAIGEGYLATEAVPADELYACALGAFDMEKVKSYVAKTAAVTALNLDTVVIAECEAGYADEGVDLLNESLAQSVSYIRMYPFGVAKVEGARIYKVENTVMLILAGASADSEATAEDEAKLAAEEYEKIDAALEALFGTELENLAVIPEPENGGGKGGMLGG